MLNRIKPRRIGKGNKIIETVYTIKKFSFYEQTFAIVRTLFVNAIKPEQSIASENNVYMRACFYYFIYVCVNIECLELDTYYNVYNIIFQHLYLSVYMRNFVRPTLLLLLVRCFNIFCTICS